MCAYVVDLIACVRVSAARAVRHRFSFLEAALESCAASHVTLATMSSIQSRSFWVNSVFVRRSLDGQMNIFILDRKSVV